MLVHQRRELPTPLHYQLRVLVEQVEEPSFLRDEAAEHAFGSRVVMRAASRRTVTIREQSDPRGRPMHGERSARYTVPLRMHREGLVARRVESGTSSPLHVSAENQLRVALDNMPGALVYTDAALDIVFCNDRFKEMYPVPDELLSPGGPIADFLRYLAENGYYGEGDVERWSRSASKACAIPSGRSFEDHTPDGRWYRILRRRVDGWRHGHGDDRHHRAEAGASRISRTRKRSSTSRSTTCRARSSTPTSELEHRRLQRPLQGDVHRFRRSCCSPAGLIPTSCATWPRTATTARATSRRWWRSASRACAIRPGKSFEDHAPDGRWYRILRRARRRRRHGHGDDRHHRAEAGRARPARGDAAHRGSEQAHHGEEPRARSALPRDPRQEPRSSRSRPRRSPNGTRGSKRA